MANAHQWRNLITRLRVNSVWHSDVKEIPKRVEFFFLLLSDIRDWKPCTDGLVFKFLGSEDSIMLKEPSSKEKVLAAIVGLRADKSPRLNGFPMAILKHC